MIVVVMGPSGAGKTTVGRALAAALDHEFVEGDDYHTPAAVAKMAAGGPLTDADREPWLRALADLLAAAWRERRSLVLACSALRRAYRERLRPPGAAPDECWFVLLHAPPAVLAERLSRRRGHYFPVALLESQLETLEAPVDDPRAGTLVVDATDPPQALVARIRRGLGVGDA